MTNTHAACCDGPAHRAFDFWLGEWVVTTPDGTVAGTNRIERKYNGCVRQLWESTDAQGRWTVAFDGRYTRK